MANPTLTLPRQDQPFLAPDGVTVSRPWRIFFDSLQGIATQNTGTVTHTGSLTADHLILGNGAADIRALAVTGTSHDVLHGAAAGDPTFSPVDLAADVTGRLPYANLTAATAASELLGRGSAAGAGDWQPLTLGSGLSMSGTVLASLFSAVPVFVASGDTFTVPVNTQALFEMTIDNEGTLIVDGYLVQVD